MFKGIEKREGNLNIRKLYTDMTCIRYIYMPTLTRLYVSNILAVYAD